MNIASLFEDIANEYIAIAADFDRIMSILSPSESLMLGWELILNEDGKKDLAVIKDDISRRAENIDKIAKTIKCALNNPAEKELDVDEVNKAIKRVAASVEYVHKLLEDENWFSVKQPEGCYKETQDAYLNFAKVTKSLFGMVEGVDQLSKPPKIEFMEINPRSKTLSESVSGKKPEITDEIMAFHRDRIARHISQVQENIDIAIEKNKNHDLDYPLSMARITALFHDEDKTGDLNEPYAMIDWMYKEGKHGRHVPYTKEMKEATRKHCSRNKHHPEAWDTRYVTNFKLFDTGNDRDGNSGVAIDATEMEFSYLCEMVADWKAVALERGNLAWSWYKQSVPARFVFTETQKYIIEEMLKIFEGEYVKEDADLPPQKPGIDQSMPSGSNPSFKTSLTMNREPAMHRPRGAHNPDVNRNATVKLVPPEHVYDPDKECPIDYRPPKEEKRQQEIADKKQVDGVWYFRNFKDGKYYDTKGNLLR